MLGNHLNSIGKTFLVLILVLLHTRASQGAVLVSNIGETVAGDSSVFRSPPFLGWVAQRFTAGTSTIIGSIALQIGVGGESAGGFRVAIFSNTGGDLPGSSLATFSGEVDPADNSTETYTGSFTVTAGTSYWVVASIISPVVSSEKWSFSTSTADTGASDWSIANSAYSTLNGGADWDETLLTGAQLMSIGDLAVVPEPTRFVLLSLGLVGIIFHRRR